MNDLYYRAFRLVLLLAIAFVIVAFGQPAWVPSLAPVAAVAGYAIVWYALLNLKRRLYRFLLAAVWFTGVQMIQLSWMTTDVLQGGYVYFMWSFFAVSLGVQFGLLSLLLCQPRQMTLLRLLAIPAAWTVMEWLRLYFLIGYTWNPAGLALTAYTIPAQFVTLAGVLGLSFWVILVNACVFRAFAARGINRYRRARYCMGATMLALVPYLYGGGHLLYHLRHGHDSFKAVLVQTGLGPDEIAGHIFPENRLPGLEQWARILVMVAGQPQDHIDLVVLPEGALPFTSSAESYPYDLVEAVFIAVFGGRRGFHTPAAGLVSNSYMCQMLANSLDCDVIAGFDDYDADSGHVYNAALLFHPGSSKVERYAKQRLLPIAETVPYEWLRPLAERYGIKGSFTPGEESVLFQSVATMGVTICYEETMQDLSRTSRKQGATALLNLSTDGWFPQSKLPIQHFTHGRLRALENGVPLIRACHTGITAAVDSLGRTVAQVGDWQGHPEAKSEALFVEVPTYTYRTLYMAVGNLLPVGASAGILIAFFSYLVWKRRR